MDMGSQFIKALLKGIKSRVRAENRKMGSPCMCRDEHRLRRTIDDDPQQFFRIETEDRTAVSGKISDPRYNGIDSFSSRDVRD
jgi:hypothetical protein